MSSVAASTFPRRGKVPEGRMGDVEDGLLRSPSTSPIRRATRATFPLRGKVKAFE